MFFFYFSLSFSLPNHFSPIHLENESESLRHFECFNLLRMLNHELHKEKNVSTLTVDFTSHCSKLSDTRKNVCLSIFPSRLTFVVSELKENKQPDSICDSLGFPRNVFPSQVVSKSQCEKVVQLIRKEGKKAVNSDTNSLEKFPQTLKRGGFDRLSLNKLFGLSTVCKSIASEDRMSCLLISRKILQEFQEELDHGISEQEICAKMEAKKHFKMRDDPK
jgi:hypothetical protein